ncbi:MAG TPA: acyltransferase [Gemmatimonadaceae bacterium]
MPASHETTVTTALRTESHIPALDGVRGLAILVVMLGHFTLAYRPVHLWEAFLKRFLETGWLGVDLFFVLSGFLITGILLQAKGSKHYFRNFYARRTLRIFPLYYGFLIAFFIIAPLVHPPAPGGQFESWQKSQWWFWTYLSNYQILFPQWARPYPLTHFWTLAVEEQFYLFWPAVVLLTSRKGLIRVCLATVVVALAVRIALHVAGIPETAGYRITPARIDTLAIGALLAVLVLDDHARELIRRYALRTFLICVTIMAAIAIPARTLPQSSFPMQLVGYPAIAVASALLISRAVDGSGMGLLNRFFSTRVMRFLGKYSYGIYVIHFPLTRVFDRVGLRVASFPTIAGSELPGAIAYAAIATTVSILLALLSWHLYEKRFLSLKRLFPRREPRRGKSGPLSGTEHFAEHRVTDTVGGPRKAL